MSFCRCKTTDKHKANNVTNIWRCWKNRHLQLSEVEFGYSCKVRNSLWSFIHTLSDYTYELHTKPWNETDVIFITINTILQIKGQQLRGNQILILFSISPATYYFCLSTTDSVQFHFWYLQSFKDTINVSVFCKDDIQITYFSTTSGVRNHFDTPFLSN